MFIPILRSIISLTNSQNTQSFDTSDIHLQMASLKIVSFFFGVHYACFKRHSSTEGGMSPHAQPIFHGGSSTRCPRCESYSRLFTSRQSPLGSAPSPSP